MITPHLPTVHLNGTSAKCLFDGYLAAYEAMADALSAMEKIEFNARDYYVQGPDAWTKARNERLAQYAKLTEVRAYLLAIAMHVQPVEK